MQQAQQREEIQTREQENALRQPLNLQPNDNLMSSLQALVSNAHLQRQRTNELEQQLNATQEQLEGKNQRLTTTLQEKERVEMDRNQQQQRVNFLRSALNDYQQREQRLYDVCGVNDPTTLYETVKRLKDEGFIHLQ